jgi:hypothetical protein
MMSKLIDGALEEHAAKLWNAKGGRRRSDGLPLPRFRPRGGPRTEIRAAVRRAPEVMVKVTGGGRGMGPIGAHMDYISKNGTREIETDDGGTLKGKEALRDLKRAWRYAGSEIPQTSHRREAFNVILSMPKGTEAAIVRAAARDMARAEFRGHRYLMVLHTHQANPHVHVLVRAESEDGGRLNPRKADLHRWRERFASALRSYGVEAAATRQAPRGAVRTARQIWQVYGERGGTLRAVRPGEKSGEALRISRMEALENWQGIARTLESSDHPDDWKLAREVHELMRDMPFKRQLERGVERGANEPRPPVERG